jgi:O-antigen ligase
MVTGGYVRGGIVEDVIDKVTSRTESSYVWILAFLGVSLLGLWAYLILQSKPIIATCLLIILLPFTRRGGDFIYIAAWETSDGYQEKISLTTFMLVLFFFVLFFRRRRKGLPGKFSSTGFLLLVCMAFGVTGMQFLHHDIFSAFWLSCSSVWQYVALAYIISGSVESFSDIRKIVWSLCIVILEAIIIRVAIFHQFFNVGGIGGAVYGQADADYARIGSIAFGGIYYSGYLVTIIYLALYLFRSASSNYTRLFCAAIIGLFFCDLVGTFTRGAWLGTFFIFLLVFWKRQRMFGLIILGSVAVTIAVFWPVLEPMVTARLTLSVSDFNDGSAMTRFMLWNDNIIRFVHDPSALFFGYGIGLAPLTAGAYEQNTYYSTHNLLLEMTSSCGILAPLLLLCLFGYAFINLFKLSRVAALKKESELAVYLFLALLTWFWFANTTSLDVLFYVPFEATILFYTIVFISLRLLDISIKPHVPRAARPHSNGENELIQNSVAHSRP